LKSNEPSASPLRYFSISRIKKKELYVGNLESVFIRILTAFAVTICAVTIVFFFIHVIPGDPIVAILGEQAALQDVEQLRMQLGLDLPLVTQWVRFFSGLVVGDFGFSFYYHGPVTPIIVDSAIMTFSLACVAFIIAASVGIPLGIAAALFQQRAWDRIAVLLALVSMSIPNFVFGPILIILFSVKLQWLPIGLSEGPLAIVLPALALGLSLSALTMRMTRASVIEVLREPYILAVRAKGLSESRIMLVHVLRNALLPVITTLGLQLGVLLGGAVVTEAIFGWPGLGSLVIESISRRDYPMVQASVLVIAISYIFINMMTDILYKVFDPRVELA
jgi:peptide/nickel transport system permease protein